MGRDTLFSGEPTNTHERIMRATYAALVRYGYGSISIKRIADEADLSKSAFYNHYESKDALLLGFLDFMLEQYRTEFDRVISGDPVTDLNTLVVHAISGDLPANIPERDRPEVSVDGPLIELRAQAVHDESFRERFSHLDEEVAAGIATIVQSGVEQGVFREVDPDRAAEVLLTIVMGAILRRSTIEGLDEDLLRTEVDRLLQTYLMTDSP